MRIQVTHTIGDLERDMVQIVERAPRDMARVVREGIRVGNAEAKSYAKQSAGRHGKHYHRAFTAEMTGPTSGEYGPDSGRPQGGMSFERGSRNQKPHNDLAKSADLIGPAFAREVRALPDDWFWL